MVRVRTGSGCSARQGAPASSSWSSLTRSTRVARIGHRGRELMGGVEQGLDVLRCQPGRGAAQQAEERRRLGREHPLERAPAPGAASPAPCGSTPPRVGRQPVLDRVHPGGVEPRTICPSTSAWSRMRWASSSAGTRDGLALPHRGAEPVDGAQRLAARARRGEAIDADAHRRHLGSVEGEVEQHVVRARRPTSRRPARCARSPRSSRSEPVESPPAGRGAGRSQHSDSALARFEVQPEERAVRLRLEPRCGGLRLDRPAGRVRREQIAAHEPVLVRPVAGQAVVHGARRLPASCSASRAAHVTRLEVSSQPAPISSFAIPASGHERRARERREDHEVDRPASGACGRCRA